MPLIEPPYPIHYGRAVEWRGITLFELPEPRYDGDIITVSISHQGLIYLRRDHHQPWIACQGPIHHPLIGLHTENGGLRWFNRTFAQNELTYLIFKLLLDPEEYSTIHLPVEPGENAVRIYWPEASPLILGISENIIRPIIGPIKYRLELRQNLWFYEDCRDPSNNGIFGGIPEGSEIGGILDEPQFSLQEEFFSRAYP